MFVAIVRHTVEDFAAWKNLFDNHEARISAGFGDTRVFTSIDDRNDVMVVIEFDDMEKGRAFMESEDLRRTMEKGGVTAPPAVFIGNRE